MPREGINKTFLIGGVPTIGLDKHVMKKNLERRGLKRGNTVRFTEKTHSPKNVWVKHYFLSTVKCITLFQ